MRFDPVIDSALVFDRDTDGTNEYTAAGDNIAQVNGQNNGIDLGVQPNEGQPMIARVNVAVLDYTTANETYRIDYRFYSDASYTVEVGRVQQLLSAASPQQIGYRDFQFQPLARYMRVVYFLAGTTPSLTIGKGVVPSPNANQPITAGGFLARL